MSDERNPFEDSDEEWALERWRNRYRPTENQLHRQATDTAVAEQEAEERREAAKKRVKLWRDITPRAETVWDRLREGRSAT